MNKEKFVSWARTGAGTLRVDGVEILTADGTVGGHGTLRSENGRFVLDITLHGPQHLPELKGGYYSREEFWKVGGRVEDSLPFRAEGLPSGRSSHQGHYSVNRASFAFDHVSLATEYTRTSDRHLASLLEKTKKTEKTPSRWWGYAYLEGNKPVWHNAGTTTKAINDFLGDSEQSSLDTFKGSFDDFEFGLIDAGEDCEAYFRSIPGSIVSEECFLRTFDSFRQAIAFIQGREAWAQHLRVSSGFETIIEDVTPKRAIPTTPYQLLNEAACANGADLAEALRLATNFFQRSDETSQLIQRTLFLCRQAAQREVPIDVGNLSLCALLEGLVKCLHRQLCEDGKSSDASAFSDAKAETLEFAKRRHGEGQEGFERLIGLVSGATPYRTKDLLRWLSEKLNLRWEPEMSELLAAWQTERHPLAHGAEPTERSLNRMFVQSRLAGGINLIVARLMGYTGLAIYSALEDRYNRLPVVPTTGQVITQEQIADASNPG